MRVRHLLRAVLAASLLARCSLCDGSGSGAWLREPAPLLPASALPAGWLAHERVALSYRRTAAELASFEARCAFLVPSYEAVLSAHATLNRVLIFDARHAWNGIGDSLEQYNFLLRAGRALGRATFLHLDPCAAARHPRTPPLRFPAQKRRPGECAFDPGAFVRGLGGLEWRWDGGAAARVAAAHGGDWPAELSLHYDCATAANASARGDPWHGCDGAALRHTSNGTLLAAFGVADDPDATADAVWRYVRDSFADVPVLRIGTRDPTDLERVGKLPWVCAAMGHEAPDPPGSSCDVSCEAFANWRPKAALWAAMRAPLMAMDRWDGVVGVLLRSGAADQVLLHGTPLLRQQNGSTAADADAMVADVAALMAPCADGTPGFRRERTPGAAPCVNYASEQRGQPPPNATDAAACGDDGRHNDAPMPPDAMGTPLPGPLGAYVECAARAAFALAGRATPAANATSAASRRFGVLLFSDAPAFKCVLEGSELAARGHAAVTATAPGHVSLAPAGPALHDVAVASLVDHYLMGLVDLLLSMTQTAYAGAAALRRQLPVRVPGGGGVHAPALQPGFERWFAVGRDSRVEPPPPEDLATLRLLLAAPPHSRCPLTAAGMARAADAYERSSLHAQQQEQLHGAAWAAAAMETG